MLWLRNHVHVYGRVWGAYWEQEQVSDHFVPSSCALYSCYITCCDHLLIVGKMNIRYGHEAEILTSQLISTVLLEHKWNQTGILKILCIVLHR